MARSCFLMIVLLCLMLSGIGRVDAADAGLSHALTQAVAFNTQIHSKHAPSTGVANALHDDCDGDGCADGHCARCACGCGMNKCASPGIAVLPSIQVVGWIGHSVSMMLFSFQAPAAVHGTSPLRPPIA